MMFQQSAFPYLDQLFLFYFLLDYANVHVHEDADDHVDADANVDGHGCDHGYGQGLVLHDCDYDLDFYDYDHGLRLHDYAHDLSFHDYDHGYSVEVSLVFADLLHPHYVDELLILLPIEI